jgi:protein O-mannosyl-transferase
MNKLKNYFNTSRIVLALIVFVFYGNTLKNGYALDDYIVTEPENITTQGLKAIPKIIKSFYVDRSEDVKFDYRPMVKICFAFEHELFGVNAAVSHFFNLILYIVGLYLLYSLLLVLFSNYDSKLIFYVVALFAIMPIHSEVVASLKNRDILLCFIFCMAGFKNFILFFEADKKRWWTLCVSLLCFYAAFLSKFDAFPYIAIVPVLIFVKHRAQLKWIILFCILLIASYYLFKYTKKQAVGKVELGRLYYYFENPLYSDKSFLNRIIATFNCLGFYINQTIFPFKQSCYYGLDTISVFKLQLWGYIGIIASPILVIGLIKTFIKKDFMLFSGLLIFCASVSMYLNLVRPAVGIVADRFAFFSSLGISIIAISLLTKYFALHPLLNKNVKILFGSTLIVFLVMSFNRNKDWDNINTLVNADYKKYPTSAFLNYKQGLNIVKAIEDKSSPLSVDQKRAKVQEARLLIEKSISIDSTYSVSQSYISYLLVYLLNDFNAALPHINAGLKLKESTELYFYKAICLREIKQKDSSELYLLKCIERDNKYYNAYNLLMYDYNANKDYQKSVDLFKSAIQNGVETLEIYNALGKTYWEMGNNSDANTYYKKALSIDNTNQEAAAMVVRTSTIKDSTTTQ